MGNRPSFFIYLFFTSAILAYAAVRFASDDTPAKKIRIYSDTTPIDGAIRDFTAQNSPQEIAAQILETFPNIENASIKNNRNGIIDVRLKHKKIVGIWQNGNIFYPLLENGTHIKVPFKERPKKGLVFRGPVPNDISEIIRLVSSNPDVAKKTDYLEYVENRRWNIKLGGGATIMLPERAPSKAFDRIKSLGIMNKSFNALDLRDEKRALVK
ncbi:MAG: cell division protein FtsQ/DivIB [Rickettsiales bacterium]|jgi:cell division septal protein FtsQ|nr:cell division protein FtsQ/DivIB [Rickettsiales bacterium]